jgi:hypothetical protein
MADLKISELTNLTAADPANDMIPIVDVSATPPASGSTKRISINNILACSPSATLASATITGDLTVDTSTLKVDSANNRVGIGTASPGFALDIIGSSGLGIRIYESSTGNNNRLQITQEGTETRFNSAFTTGSAFYTWQIAGSEQMRLNSTGLGVGGSPTSKLTIFAGADGDVGFFRGGSTRQLQLGTSATAGYLNVDNGSSGFELRVNGVARVYADTSGNVGVGVSTFGTSAAKVLGLADATAPSTSPAGMGQLYVEAGALKYRGSSGTVTTIANA